MKLKYIIIVVFIYAFTLVKPCNNHAQGVLSVGPFTGTYSESFESFPDYFQQGLPETSGIMGGFAFISSAHHNMAVYNPSAGAIWGLGTILAGVSDGLQGLGLNSADDSLTINFSSPVTGFGGYFAADNYAGMSPLLTFNFSDGNSGSYYYSDPNGTLAWVGWDFSVGVNSVMIGGNFFAVDGLQATVPEPTSFALFSLGGLVVFAVGSYRKSRNVKITTLLLNSMIGCNSLTNSKSKTGEALGSHFAGQSDAGFQTFP